MPRSKQDDDTVAHRRRKGEAKAKSPAKVIQMRCFRLQVQTELLQEMVKWLAKCRARFLFPVIRQAFCVGVRTKGTLTATHVPSPMKWTQLPARAPILEFL
jgi:hypothetical protein